VITDDDMILTMRLNLPSCKSLFFKVTEVFCASSLLHHLENVITLTLPKSHHMEFLLDCGPGQLPSFHFILSYELDFISQPFSNSTLTSSGLQTTE